MSQFNSGGSKEKFRPAEDPSIVDAVEAAVGNVDALYGFDAPKPEAEAKPAEPAGQEAARPAQQRQVKRGKVVALRKDDVFIDVGGKSQGVCPVLQFNAVKVGDEFDFIVERYDDSEGILILSLAGAAASHVSWESVQVGQVVEGICTGMNKGGLEVDVKGIRAFMPAGQVDLYFLKDISMFLSQKVTAEVMQVDREKKNLIISRRVVLEREKEEARKKLMGELAEGQMRRGVVRSVMDFGAFVDLGGVDGLIHVSEMSFRRIRHPQEVVQVNDLVEVKVLKIDPDSGKVSLSLKQAMADPWADASNKYPVGAETTGLVARVENFGAFITVEEGVEGLLPVSEMSWQRIKHPGDLVKEGQTLRLTVIALDVANHKLTLSLKQAGPDPWKAAADKYKPHTVTAGKVARVVDFGAFVELEPGLEGLVHISELSDQRVRSASDVVKPGQEVQVKVLEVNPAARRISLSIRRANEPAPEPPKPPTSAEIKARKQRDEKRLQLRGGLDFDFRKNK